MMPKMGGMLRYGIPEYRLPKKLLDREISQIEALGVNLKIMLGSAATFNLKNYDTILMP